MVLASHYPFINFPGFYFSKMYQVTSYAIGIEIDDKLRQNLKALFSIDIKLSDSVTDTRFRQS